MTIENNINWEKVDGMIPAIIQDARSGAVLMLGYMNRDALAKTQETGLACFFSRTRQALWTKGETSGNTLRVQAMTLDCDYDTLLIQAVPAGPTCHTGKPTCFDGDANFSLAFLSQLESIIEQRLAGDSDDQQSYTAKLAARGQRYIAQKVGEEAVEVAVAAASDDTQGVIDESADLLYHLLVLLNQQGLSLSDVATTLADRHIAASSEGD